MTGSAKTKGRRRSGHARGLVRWRKAVLALAAIRGLLGIIAIPLAPLLFEDHFVLLVLLRPTKEVLLAGGFLLREGDVGLIPVVASAVPLLVFGVWLFFLLGRSFADEIQSGEGLPKFADRILPPKRIQAMCKILKKKGAGVVVAGRLAAFPSTVLASAAGASDMKSRQFLPADALGAALSLVEVVGAGFVLGAAYKDAGPWLTVVGVIVLIGLMVVVGRWLKKESAKD